jgi:4-hydroxy-3-polyprenylbenzoate decarboxylase
MATANPAQRTTRQGTAESPTTEQRAITLAITGASGAIYARAMLRLLEADRRVGHIFLVASDAGLRLLASELGVVAADGKKLPSLLLGIAAKKTEYVPNKDIGASIASGSAIVDAMAVVPCSAGAMGAIASGIASDLLTRAADVCLKERRPLVLCLRETPLNRIHIENMLRLHDAGATVMPATPAFYYEPKDIEEMVEQFACRVLAQLGLPQEKQYRWTGKAQKG